MDERRIGQAQNAEVESTLRNFIDKEFFNNLPTDLQDYVGNDYDAREGRQSPVHELYDLLHRIHNNLQSGDTRIRTGAGRLLQYFRMDADHYLSRIEDASNRDTWHKHLDTLWESAGQAANEEYMRLRDERRATALGTNEGVRTKEVRHPELMKLAHDNIEEIRAKILEIQGKNKRLQSYIDRLPGFCQEQVGKLRQIASTLQSLDGDQNRTQSIELAARIIERIPIDPSLARVVESLPAVNEPAPLRELDEDMINTLNAEQARVEIKKLYEDNKWIARDYQNKLNSLVKNTQRIFTEVTRVASVIHNRARYADGQAANILRSAANDLDSKLQTVFQINRLEVSPGMDFNDVAIGNRIQAIGTVDTEDPSKDDTIASVSNEAYSFDPELRTGMDPNGDVFQKATVNVYRYNKIAGDNGPNK